MAQVLGHRQLLVLSDHSVALTTHTAFVKLFLGNQLDGAFTIQLFLFRLARLLHFRFLAHVCFSCLDFALGGCRGRYCLVFLHVVFLDGLALQQRREDSLRLRRDAPPGRVPRRQELLDGLRQRVLGLGHWLPPAVVLL